MPLCIVSMTFTFWYYRGLPLRDCLESQKRLWTLKLWDCERLWALSELERCNFALWYGHETVGPGSSSPWWFEWDSPPRVKAFEYFAPSWWSSLELRRHGWKKYITEGRFWSYIVRVQFLSCFLLCVEMWALTLQWWILPTPQNCKPKYNCVLSQQ